MPEPGFYGGASELLSSLEGIVSVNFIKRSLGSVSSVLSHDFLLKFAIGVLFGLVSFRFDYLLWQCILNKYVGALLAYQLTNGVHVLAVPATVLGVRAILIPSFDE